jgi:hydroxyacylglutathione hydrolase
MYIEPLTVGEFQANCFVLWAKRTAAIVIDPGADPRSIEELLKDKDLTPAAYLLTHGHYDHVSALHDICKIMPAPVGIHDSDLGWAFSSRCHHSTMRPV